MKAQNDLSKLSLVALRNLFFEETRAFLLALDKEMAEGFINSANEFALLIKL